MKKLFNDLNMSWKNVILFAVIIAVYTGLIMVPPFLKDTSFQDIGALYEWWVVFAVIIVVNCEKNWEAMLKCFVFFLISQPLIYLVEIPFGLVTFNSAWGYYTGFWLPMTVLTLPGGFIAYYCKKQNILGAVILGVGNTIQAIMGIGYVLMILRDFPHHILSCLFSFASIIVMSLAIQKEKKNRAIAIAVPVVLAMLAALFLKLTGRVFA